MLNMLCYLQFKIRRIFTMAIITSDTLIFVEKLKVEGVTELQAKAESEALQERGIG